MVVWTMIFLFQGCILRFHVNLPGCTSKVNTIFAGPGLLARCNSRRHWRSSKNETISDDGTISLRNKWRIWPIRWSKHATFDHARRGGDTSKPQSWGLKTSSQWLNCWFLLPPIQTKFRGEKKTPKDEFVVRASETAQKKLRLLQSLLATNLSQLVWPGNRPKAHGAHGACWKNTIGIRVRR